MFQWPVPDLVKTVPPGAVYMGVAPDQNFTYIAAVKPRMAFIVDIRRGNLLQHLLYKALFELSADRAEFLARLFSMPKLTGVTATSTARELFDAVYRQTSDKALFEANTKQVLALLTGTHKFALSIDDEAQLTWIYGCFFTYGPDLTYQRCESGSGRGFGGRGGGRFGGGRFRSFADLQLQTDAAGVEHAYLANDAAFQWMKQFEGKNLLVPVMGDFMGPKAIRAVGAWVGARGGTVGAFYTSNVEEYLFRSSTWGNFYRNLAALPLDGRSQLIRSVPNRMVVPRQPGETAASMLSTMTELTAAFAAGKIQGYADVVALSRQ